MSKEIYISSTPQETRLAIVEKDELTEIYYERENEYTLAGSIYNGRVTRVLPGMQSSFVDIGLERDAFLYITDFMEEAADTADFDGGASGGDARSSRGDRPRGEGRGRGRRDGREGDRRPRETQPERVRTDSPVEEFKSHQPVERDGLEAEPRDIEGDDLGDGAPGADGARRWRGRRGRRRGRGGAGEQVADVAALQGTSGDEHQQVQESRAGGEILDGERRPTELRGDGAGRDRGGRDRGGRDRGGRDLRHDAVRERFAPRGARAASSGEDEGVDLSASAGPQPEPFILPGESLSKYRRGQDGEQGAAVAASGSVAKASGSASGSSVTAKPSTEIEPLVGWDGGLVLPGESLRAREPRAELQSTGRGTESGSERGGRDAGRGGDRGRDRRRDRDEQRGREGRGYGRDGAQTEYRAAPRGIDPAEAVLPAVSSQHDLAEREYEPEYPAFDAADVVAASEPTAEHAAEFEFAVEELHEAEFQEVTTEYEPDENASASFRVDPSGQRKFRQSAAPDEHLHEHEAAPEAEVATAAAHDFTTLQATGELISAVPEEVRAASPQTELTGPMEHEAAVQSVRAGEAETVPVDMYQVPILEQAQGATGFAPGQGELEEELMDDEELDLDSIHAGGSMEEHETEEETLEGAADLASMIRDMTIDDITRTEPSEADEDEEMFSEDEDFEEDELASSDEEDSDDDEISGSELSEVEEEEFAEAASFEVNGTETERAEGERAPREGGLDGARRGRRDGRRGGRGGDRNGGDRERSSERGGSRDRRGMAGSRSGGGGRDRGHRSMQSTNLPAISDLLKPGQEVLVQIAKEPIAKKGARITSHIALPGRFLVFMPTVNHTGVSRKIESDGERRRLKEILLSEKGDASGGFIVRTAAAGATEEELRSDLRFLLNLWTDIKSRSESSKSPALIYHDLNLVERILRDQVTDNFSAIWVDTEAEYERVLRFLQRFQPSLIRRVKLYTKDTPLFEQFGITEEINKALRAKVWLKSGGSIVINQTEALVAIDINTGKFVGKTARLEDTILKTNLDAIPEIVRQIRLRDLGGIIIIDFIDMDERKNRAKVMAALEEELKSDRAPSKVLQFNDFGLVAITRKRVKQSLERTLSTTCGVCAGTGMVKSPVTVCNDIYIEMRKMHKVIEKGDIMLRVHPEVVKQLKSGSGKWLQEMEEMSGKTILVKSDPALHPEQFDIH